MQISAVIPGPIITLRPLTEANATEEYASWLNDPEVNKYLETRKVTVDELKSFINEKNASETALFLGVFWNENGKHIGNVKLEPIDCAKKEATMGILIGDKNYWGKGVATEATNLVAGYAFTKMGLKELKLGVIPENKAAIRVYEKCGFTMERVEKGAVNHDGVLHDRMVMRKLAPANPK